MGGIGRLLALGAAAAALAPGSALAGENIRKDVKDLKPSERRAFVEAVLALKRTPSPVPGSDLPSYYDQLVQWHKDMVDCERTDPMMEQRMHGHAGPMFLPWHRQYLLVFERALRQVAGKPVPVPYWDWTDQASTNAVFSDDFMGGSGDPKDGYVVNTGPFRKGQWDLVVQNEGVILGRSRTSYLTRNIGNNGRTRLPAAAEVAHAIENVHEYDVAPFDDGSDPSESFRNHLEGFRKGTEDGTPEGTTGCNVADNTSGTVPTGPASVLHGAVHNWVGGAIDPADPFKLGTMGSIQTSPNDPVFFLHHANIDRIWARWQEQHPHGTYQPDASGDVSPLRQEWYEHNGVDSPLEPYEYFQATPRTVESIADLGYTYDDDGADDAATATAVAAEPRAGARSGSVRLVCRTPGGRTAS